MKRNYEILESFHIAFNRKKYCPRCGGHEYVLVNQTWPQVVDRYNIACAQCGFDTTTSATKRGAMKNWIEGV